MPECTDYFSFRLFADDSNLFHTFSAGESTIDLDKVNVHLEKVSNWCNANKLTINLSKTNYMIMSGSRKVIQVKGLLKMSNTTLNEVAVASFVGLNIDKHLTWKPHIEIVNKSIRKKIGIIYRLRSCVPQKILILLYKTLVQPHITYGIEVWGSTYETNLKCILLSPKNGSAWYYI